MATTNFKLFDENKSNLLSDAEYANASQRLNGVQTGVASSQLNNKFAYQVSLVAYAIAQLMNANGLDANDTLAVSAFVGNLQGSLLQKVIDKASSEEAVNGVSTTKWMTPALTKAAIEVFAAQSQNILSSETKEKFGLSSSDTPDDLFDLFYSYGVSGINNPFTIEKITTSKDWIAPNDLRGDVTVIAFGGGGGGGGSRTQGGGGGGAGGYVKIKNIPVSPNESVSITIGSGGTGGSFNGNGGTGGTTSFGTHISAPGGGGGYSNGTGGSGDSGGGGGSSSSISNMISGGNGGTFGGGGGGGTNGNGGNGGTYGGGGGAGGGSGSSSIGGAGGTYGAAGGEKARSGGSSSFPFKFYSLPILLLHGVFGILTSTSGKVSSSGSMATRGSGGGGGYGSAGGTGGAASSNNFASGGGGGGLFGNGGSGGVSSSKNYISGGGGGGLFGNGGNGDYGLSEYYPGGGGGGGFGNGANGVGTSKVPDVAGYGAGGAGGTYGSSWNGSGGNGGGGIVILIYKTKSISET